ncbi:unnamed protein product, partial [Rotaria sordida]
NDADRPGDRGLGDNHCPADSVCIAPHTSFYSPNPANVPGADFYKLLGNGKYIKGFLAPGKANGFDGFCSLRCVNCHCCY